MIVMSLVFGGFAPNRSKYPVFFITGYIIWTMFNVGTNTSLTVFVDNKNLFQRTKLPRGIFVLSRNYTAVVNLGYSLIALLIVLIVFGIRLHYTLFFVFIDIFFELLFSIGVSYILSTIYVFYKDIKYIWKNIIVIFVHTIGVYIPVERYPVSLHHITKLNPLFVFSDIARKCVLDGCVDFDQVIYMVTWSIMMFAIGITVFKLNENAIVKEL